MPGRVTKRPKRVTREPARMEVPNFRVDTGPATVLPSNGGAPWKRPTPEQRDALMQKERERKAKAQLNKRAGGVRALRGITK